MLSQQAAAAGEPRGMSVVAWLRREHEDYTSEQVCVSRVLKTYFRVVAMCLLPIEFGFVFC